MFKLSDEQNRWVEKENERGIYLKENDLIYLKSEQQRKKDINKNKNIKRKNEENPQQEYIRTKPEGPEDTKGRPCGPPHVRSPWPEPHGGPGVLLHHLSALVPLYCSETPKNIYWGNFPPPPPCVPRQSKPESFSGTLPEGEIIVEVIFINLAATMSMCK